VFDRLYATVHTGEPVGAELLTALNATQAALGPRIAEKQRAAAKRRRGAQGRSESLDDDDPPSW
jgi:hypothetical protein